MKKITLIALVTMAFACTSKTDKVKNEIEKIGTTYISHQLPPGEKIDSISLIRYDTLTSEVENDYLWYEYNKIVSDLLEESKGIRNHYEIKDQLYSLSPTPQIREEMDDLEDKYNKIQVKGKFYDSIATALKLLRKTVRKDDFKGYRGFFKIKYTTSAGVQQTVDSFEVAVSPDYKIRDFKNEVKKL